LRCSIAGIVRVVSFMGPDGPRLGVVEGDVVVVLHDLPGGALAHLPAFLDRALEESAQFTSDFPPSCVVVERGVPRDGLEAYVRMVNP
jgi:hypothetical protein